MPKKKSKQLLTMEELIEDAARVRAKAKLLTDEAKQLQEKISALSKPGRNSG